MTAIQQLYEYFGLIGIFSIALYLCAVLFMLAFAVRWRRSQVCWTALALAVAGLILAHVNSNIVSNIKIDFSADISQANARTEEAHVDEAASVESDSSEPAEEGRDDAVDDTADTLGNENLEQNAEAVPEYRRAGKVEREEGKQAAEKISVGSAESDQQQEAHVRTMTHQEVMHANRLDRLNLLFARATLYLAVIVVVVDYFRRFNSTFDCYLPVPFSGRLVDALFPKSYAVLAGGGDRNWKAFLERAVQKGETFILIANADPWTEHRLSRLPGFLHRLGWRIEIVSTDDNEARFDDEFLFESAWFARYCFVILGGRLRAIERLETIIDSLELRRSTRATARRTLNLVWTLEAPIPSEILRRLVPLCEQTNIRLIATSLDEDEGMIELFDEACV